MPYGLQDPDSPTRDWTRTMAVKARSLNHWTTREFPGIIQDMRGRDTGSSSNVDIVGAVDSLNLKIKVIWTLCIPPSRRGYCTIILGALQGCGSEVDGRMDFAPSSPVVWSPFRDLQMFHCFKGLPQWFSSKELVSNAGATGDVNSIPGLERSPGEGNGNPLQCSCLEDPMDRRACTLLSIGSQRIRHSWSDLAHRHTVSSPLKRVTAYLALFGLGCGHPGKELRLETAEPAAWLPLGVWR